MASLVSLGAPLRASVVRVVGARATPSPALSAPVAAASVKFKNYGRRLWDAERALWLTPVDAERPAGTKLPWRRLYTQQVRDVQDLLRDPAKAGPLPVALPLSQVVELVLDVWDEQGLVK
jgi:hypothetical protein